MFASLLKFQLVLGMPNDGAHMWRVGLVWPWGLFPPPWRLWLATVCKQEVILSALLSHRDMSCLIQNSFLCFLWTLKQGPKSFSINALLHRYSKSRSAPKSTIFLVIDSLLHLCEKEQLHLNCGLQKKLSLRCRALDASLTLRDGVRVTDKFHRVPTGCPSSSSSSSFFSSSAWYATTSDQSRR